MQSKLFDIITKYNYDNNNNNILLVNYNNTGLSNNIFSMLKSKYTTIVTDQLSNIIHGDINTIIILPKICNKQLISTINSCYKKLIILIVDRKFNFSNLVKKVNCGSIDSIIFANIDYYYIIIN